MEKALYNLQIIKNKRKEKEKAPTQVGTLLRFYMTPKIFYQHLHRSLVYVKIPT